MLARAPRFRLALLVCFALGLGVLGGRSFAADADMQQKNVIAANAEAANAANALTGQFLIPTDGKLISADAYAAGKAAVNVPLLRLAERIAGVRCGLYGNCMGVDRRTMYSISVDGIGGAVSTAVGGVIQGQGLIGSLYVVAQSGSGANQLNPTNGSLSVTGGGGFTWRDSYIGFTGTSAGGSNPTPATAGKNRLNALKISKAWGVITTDGAGAVALDDGAGITAVAIVANTIRVTMADAMDTIIYKVTGSQRDAGVAKPFDVDPATKTTTQFYINFGATNPAAVVVHAEFDVDGRQTT